MSSVTLRLEKPLEYKDISFYSSVTQENLSIIRRSRKIIEQEPIEKVPLGVSQSLMKIVLYLSKEPQINDLSEVKVEHLLNYFNEEKRKGFCSVSFQQTIKDLKHVITYLKDYKEIQNPPYINFSIQNHRFWRKG